MNCRVDGLGTHCITRTFVLLYVGSAASIVYRDLAVLLSACIYVRAKHVN